MSDTSQGPGWWLASDGKWYPPDLEPGAQSAAPTEPPYQQPQNMQQPQYAPPHGVGNQGGFPQQQYAAPPAPEKKSGCGRWALIGLAVCVFLAVLVGGCIALVADDVKESLDEIETSAREQVEEFEEAAEQIETEIEDADEDGGAPSNDEPSDELADIVACGRIDENNVEVEIVNNSSKTSTYWLTIALLDESGSRVGDETGIVSYLRPGERTVEGVFVFDEAGDSCEVVDVDRTAAESDASEMSEVGSCTVAGSDGLGDVAASVVAENGSSKNSDYSVDVAFLDASGLRRGTGTSFIEVVRAGESAPGDVFATVDYEDGMTCEVVRVDRSHAAGSEDAGTAESIEAGEGASGDAADVIGCRKVDEDTIEIEVVNNSSETSSYWITLGYFTDDGARVGDENATVSSLRAGERTIEQTFSFENTGSTCEVLAVERVADVSSPDELDDAVSCEVGGADYSDNAEAKVSVTNDSSKPSDYAVTVAFLDESGVRRGAGVSYIEVVRPDETAPGDIFGLVEFSDGMTCEIVGVERSESS